MERLILDTSILVDIERGADVGRPWAPGDDLAMAAITAAELLLAVELADARRHDARRAGVEAILDEMPALPYDLPTARRHAGLLAHTRVAGRPRGAHDLIIAATALQHDRIVVTADAAGFADLPGVRLLTAER